MRPLRGLTQKGKSTNVGAGSTWPSNSWQLQEMKQKT
jgi:hypothetical protein